MGYVILSNKINMNLILLQPTVGYINVWIMNSVRKSLLIILIVNPFHANDLFPYPWKRQETNQGRCCIIFLTWSYCCCMFPISEKIAKSTWIKNVFITIYHSILKINNHENVANKTFSQRWEYRHQSNNKAHLGSSRYFDEFWIFYCCEQVWCIVLLYSLLVWKHVFIFLFLIETSTQPLLQ